MTAVFITFVIFFGIAILLAALSNWDAIESETVKKIMFKGSFVATGLALLIALPLGAITIAPNKQEVNAKQKNQQKVCNNKSSPDCKKNKFNIAPLK